MEMFTCTICAKANTLGGRTDGKSRIGRIVGGAN